MPIFKIKNKEILFIHIPKTGGTSIEKWLEEQGEMSFYIPYVPDGFKCSPQHLRLSDINLLFGEKKQWDYIFTIIRNPYDRIESEYFYRTKRRRGSHFSEWTRRQLLLYRKDNNLLDNHLRPQNHFIESNVEVFRLEDGMEQIIKTVAKKIGIKPPKEIPHKNLGKKAKVDFSTQALNLFNRIYKEDFEQLGYEMKKPQINISDLK